MADEASILADQWAKELAKVMSKEQVNLMRQGAEGYGVDYLRRSLSVMRGIRSKVPQTLRLFDGIDEDLLGGQGAVILVYEPWGRPSAVVTVDLTSLYQSECASALSCKLPPLKTEHDGRPLYQEEKLQEVIKAMERRGHTVRAAYWPIDYKLLETGSKLSEIIHDFDSRQTFEQAERAARSIDAFMTGHSGNISESLSSQLEKLFPKADGQALENIVSTLDAQIQTIRKTADNTYTGVVFDFKVDEKRVYCKVGNKEMLAKEAQYAKDAWKHQLMRPITPKLVGLVEDSELAGLLTYGTENIGIADSADFMEYFSTRSNLLNRFAQKTSLNVEDLKKDPFITDMFNRAISHTYMKEHMADPIYKTATLDSVATIEKLQSRLQDSKLSKENIDEITRLFPLYRRIAEEVSEYDKQPTILAHFDARTENIFPSTTGARPMGDFGTAKPGTPEFDLGKMEIPNTDFYVKAYAFFRNSLEQAEGNNFELTAKEIAEMQDKVRKVGFVNALKLACFKGSRGLDTNNYLTLSKQYAKLLQ